MRGDCLDVEITLESIWFRAHMAFSWRDFPRLLNSLRQLHQGRLAFLRLFHKSMTKLVLSMN